MPAYQIFTDATADFSAEMVKDLPHIEVIPMQVDVGGCEYVYGPSGTITTGEFYRLQREGQFTSTSQINPSVYLSHFEPWLRQGKDILYLCFSSGMSGTFHSAGLCAEELREKYPERKLICIDTLCASAGEGFLVREAARQQAAGASIEELAQWVMENRLRVCHWFTVDTFEHLRRGGRVSPTAAAVGTVLQIKPLLHVDTQGSLQVKEKPRGRKKAIAAQLANMEMGWTPERGKLVVIGHGDDPDAAVQLWKAVTERFPTAEIHTADIGPVIGAHTGPGMLALIYWGNTR